MSRRIRRSAAEVEAELEMLPPDDGSTSSNSLDYLDDSDASDDDDDDDILMEDDDGHGFMMGMAGNHNNGGELDNDNDHHQRAQHLRPGHVPVAAAAAAPPFHNDDFRPLGRQHMVHQLQHAGAAGVHNHGNINDIINNNNNDINNNNNNGLEATGRKRKARDGEERDENDIDMTITEEERRWSLELKSAALEPSDNDEELRQIALTLTDMEYAQHAIIARGNVPEAFTRIRRLDRFRQQYDIQDTVEQGMESIKEFMEHHPGFCLSLDQCSRHNYYVQVFDFAKFYPKTIRLPRDWKVFLRGMYYFQTALHPTLSAVRNGLLAIGECDGMGWDNFCLEFERRLWYEHIDAYPFKFHEISWVRTPLVANVAFSLLKPIMSESVRKVFHLGVKFDESYEGRLDDLFLQPTKELAKARHQQMAHAFLTRRFNNQASFKL